MKKLIITIELENDSVVYQDTDGRWRIQHAEIAGILRCFARQFGDHPVIAGAEKKAMDINGNTIGTARIVEEE